MSLRRGMLVIYGGIAGFGFTGSTVREVLENVSGLSVGGDFGLAYVPFQFSVGKGVKVGERELVVAADDVISLDAAAIVLGSVAKDEVKRVLGVKLAELATLFSVVRWAVNVALVNELAVFCKRAGVDYFEVCELFSVFGRCEGVVPSIAAEEGKTEAYLLLENAENLNSKLRLVAVAMQINEGMVKHVVNLLQVALRDCGKTLRRVRVAVLGVVGANTMARVLVRMLEAKGAKVNIYDPLQAKSELLDRSLAFKKSVAEAVEGADCMVILDAYESFAHLNLKKLRTVMRMPAAIVDLTGRFEFSGVGAEGFIFRVLGRGVEK